MEMVEKPAIDWGAAALTLPGQTQSGDLYLVRYFPKGALVAVVDGLGHGEEAAAAAHIALQTLESGAEDSVISIIRRCHERLRSTRGVVMSMASFNAVDSTITWLGVGNVAGVILHRDAMLPGRESLLLRGGVVGDQLPRLTASIIPVKRNDVLIFATDGIQSAFPEVLNLYDSPQQIADNILERYARRTDDALVLVARFMNGHDEIKHE
jgi:serine/threonine protein phosphatase PrpC